MRNDSVRFNLRVPQQVAAYLDRACAQRGLDRPAAIRRALGLMQVFDQEIDAGRYVGATRDREALETVIAAPL